MKAANFLGENKINIVEKEAPHLEFENDVIVEVNCCGLCGSDKRLFREGAKHTPGHEISGTIYKKGKDVKLRIGQRVIIYIPIYCGKCKFCEVGNTNQCQNIKELVGWQRSGGYAEYVKVPEQNVIPIPDDISDEDGVLLLDTIGTAAHAVRLAMPTLKNKEENTLVIGCGPLGLGMILVLKAFGFNNIFATDISPEKLDLSKSFGAIPIQSDTNKQKNQFKFVVEASGSSSGRETGLYSVEPGGSLVILGESNDPFIINPNPILRRKDFYTIRSFYFPLNEVNENIELYKSNKESFRKLISEIVGFDNLQNTFIKFCESKTIKPFIKMK